MQDLIETLDAGHLSFSAIVFGMLLTAFIAAGMLLDIIILMRLRRKPISLSDLASPLRATPWTLADTGIVILMLVTLFVLFMTNTLVMHYLGLDHGAESERPFSIIFQTSLFQITAFVTVFSIMRSKGISWREAFGLERRNLAKNAAIGIMLYVATMPVLIFYSLLYVLFLKQLGFPLEPQEVIILLNSPNEPYWLQIYLMLIALTTAPFLEELSFRGVGLPAALKHFKPLTAVCLVSFVFAAFHAHPASLVALFIIAVAFSLAYLYTGSIIAPIVMHIMFNGVTLAILFLLKITPDIALCRVGMLFYPAFLTSL